MEFKDLKLNSANRSMSINGEEVVLQGKQYELMEYLISSKGKILSKEQIFNRIWGLDSFVTTNVLEVYLSELRKVLKKYDYDKYIKTIRGVGYILSEKN